MSAYNAWSFQVDLDLRVMKIIGFFQNTYTLTRNTIFSKEKVKFSLVLLDNIKAQVPDRSMCTVALNVEKGKTLSVSL